MASKEHYLIIGGSTAGNSAAETLRKEGFDGRITLVGRESDRPYDRPPLSKEFLRGEKEEEKVYFKPVEFYQEQEIELKLGASASRLDTANRTVELESGESLSYDKLLLATGSRARKLDIPGNRLNGVHYLRTIGSSRRLAADIEKGSRVVLVGAGFIGLEVAASCRMKGLEVTVLEIEDVPLRHAIGEELGNICADIHRDQGVELRLGEGIKEIQGDGRAERVITSSGAELPCDVVVIGVGARPETRLVEDSNVETGDGIIVDEYCQTNVPGIYSAGDAASWWHPGLGRRIRVEHWDNAINQAAVAARNMLGGQESYSPVLYFWSDQYDCNLQYVGEAHDWDNMLYRGNPKDRKFSAFFIKDGLVQATFSVNSFRDINASRRLIADKVPIDERQLVDPDVNLRKLGAS